MTSSRLSYIRGRWRARPPEGAARRGRRRWGARAGCAPDGDRGIGGREAPMDPRSPVAQARWCALGIVLAVAVHGSGMGVPILGPGGAVYASIAKTMVQRHNYLELMVQGQDWLDKPHVPFWLTALSFRLFGVQTWAYKLPALLCLLLGAWSTYWFATQFYTRQVAQWSVLI